MYVPRRLTINRNRPRYHGLDMKKIVASMPMTLNFGGKMSVISKWMCELTEWMETVSHGMVDTEQRITKLESTVAEQAKRIDALETEGVFGKGVLTRLTKLEDWRQVCDSMQFVNVSVKSTPTECEFTMTPADPFGKYADGYPPVGHPDRRDTQTPDIDSVEYRKDGFQPTQNNVDPDPYRLSEPEPYCASPEVKITYHGNPVTDGVDFTQDALQPKQSDMNISNGILYNDEGHAVSEKPPHPELVEGFWYKTRNIGDNSLLQYQGGLQIKWLDGNNDALSLDEIERPATLNDLAHEVDGENAWLIDTGNYIVMRTGGNLDAGYLFRRPFAREYAALAHIPIITEAQWELLTNEAGK